MAFLTLVDGTVFEGELFGCRKDVAGEVVFNTGMTGYQEILSDPSYCGQMVVLTYPLAGNYGINAQDAESGGIHMRALIVQELCEVPSNWRSEESLESYIQRHGVVGLNKVDTRALTRHIRSRGAMNGIITKEKPTKQQLDALSKNLCPYPVRQVSCQEKYVIPGEGKRIAVMDFGIKHNILRSLENRGLHLTVYPYNATAEEILADGCDGVVLSNGPGDPQENAEVLPHILKLMQQRPCMGICLGHQLMALARGGNTKRMLFGHRGCNHPVKDLSLERVYITSQNHGYAVDKDALPEHSAISHVSWNDSTIEGLVYDDCSAFSVQFHPEAAPGPGDTAYLFDRFMQML